MNASDRIRKGSLHKFSRLNTCGSRLSKYIRVLTDDERIFAEIFES